MVDCLPIIGCPRGYFAFPNWLKVKYRVSRLYIKDGFFVCSHLLGNGAAMELFSTHVNWFTPQVPRTLLDLSRTFVKWHLRLSNDTCACQMTLAIASLYIYRCCFPEPVRDSADHKLGLWFCVTVQSIRRRAPY